MRSAYGLTIPEVNDELTRVGPGTPCGELMRRYWWPICLSEELRDLPKRVRILGEDLVAFRDRKGRAGALFFRCSHRGTSLEYGRIEDDGLRCCYHGWLYDVEGNVLDMPCEPPESTFKHRVKHPGYPVEEFGGLVFAYLGPPETAPPLPRFELWARPGGTLKASMGPRVGGAANCNWLQSQENLMDPLHINWLHWNHSRPQFPSELYGLWPSQIDYEETELGMRCTMGRDLPDGREWTLIWELFIPTGYVLYVGQPKTEESRTIAFCIPVDDTHQLSARISWVPDGPEPDTSGPTREQIAPIGRGQPTYEDRQRSPDDKEAQEGQGPIVIHGLEHLATSDRGVIMFRKILRAAIRAVQAGQDPKGVIRDPEKARRLPTRAGSVISDLCLTPGGSR